MGKISHFFALHRQAGLSSLGQLSRTPFASLLTCLVIGITLALPTALFLLLKNVEQIRQHFHQTSQVTLYLKNNVTQNQAQTLLNHLQKKPDIEKAYTISPTEGLAELQKQAGFQGVLEELHDNPLPWAIVVIPHLVDGSSSSLEKLNQSLQALPEVDTLQIDMLWVKRLGTLIALAKRLVFSLAIFLGIAVLLIINNTIRSATQNNRNEIDVIKLIGGTDAFIRRPFLYAGSFYGLLGGIIALQSVDIMMLLMKGPTHRLAHLYNSSFVLCGLSVDETIIILVAGMALGWMGSWMAVTRFLKFSHQ